MEDCIIPKYFSYDGEVLAINGGKLFEYNKMDSLPFEVVDLLNRRGEMDKKNYLETYLNKLAKSIQIETCEVYSTPNKKGVTIHQLRKKDTIIILDVAEKWLKVKYSENDIGWVKRSKVEKD